MAVFKLDELSEQKNKILATQAAGPERYLYSMYNQMEDNSYWHELAEELSGITKNTSSKDDAKEQKNIIQETFETLTEIKEKLDEIEPQFDNTNTMDTQKIEDDLKELCQEHTEYLTESDYFEDTTILQINKNDDDEEEQQNKPLIQNYGSENNEPQQNSTVIIQENQNNTEEKLKQIYEKMQKSIARQLEKANTDVTNTKNAHKFWKSAEKVNTDYTELDSVTDIKNKIFTVDGITKLESFLKSLNKNTTHSAYVSEYFKQLEKNLTTVKSSLVNNPLTENEPQDKEDPLYKIYTISKVETLEAIEQALKTFLNQINIYYAQKNQPDDITQKLYITFVSNLLRGKNDFEDDYGKMKTIVSDYKKLQYTYKNKFGGKNLLVTAYTKQNTPIYESPGAMFRILLRTWGIYSKIIEKDLNKLKPKNFKNVTDEIENIRKYFCEDESDTNKIILETIGDLKDFSQTRSYTEVNNQPTNNNNSTLQNQPVKEDKLGTYQDGSQLFTHSYTGMKNALKTLGDSNKNQTTESRDEKSLSSVCTFHAENIEKLEKFFYKLKKLQNSDISQEENINDLKTLQTICKLDKYPDFFKLLQTNTKFWQSPGIAPTILNTLGI